LDDPQWREAFLHPRQATGVVVQVAQAEFEWISPAPEGFPTNPSAPSAALRHVAHAVRDLDTALGLFHVLLGGTITGRAVAAEGEWEYVELSWPGPLALRLMSPTPDADATSSLRTWLGDRPGRVHHLAFDLPPTADTSAVGPAADLSGRSGVGAPGVIPGPGSVQVVAPDNNLGTGLVLRATDGVGSR
jgi:hypothetical protein